MIRSSVRLVALLVVLFLGATSAHAAIITVDCDGWGDYTTISDAIAAPPGPGDTIVVYPCTYPENVVIDAIDSLHLVSAKAWSASTLVGAEPSGVGAAPPAIAPIIDGGGAGSCLEITNSTRVSVTGFVLTNCLNHGIRASSVDLLKLHANYIGGFFGMGIRISNAGAPIITSNWVRQVEKHGIRLNNVNSAVVADNTVEGTFGANAKGIFIDNGCEQTHVLRNLVQGNASSGIHDRATATRIERNTAQWNCAMSGPSMCVCDQIMLATGSLDADVVGNAIGDGFDATCAVGWEEAENL